MSSHTFPNDLLTLQRSWQDTYTALAASRPESRTALRRRLHRLSVLLAAHPYWEPAPGGAARVELRRQARRLP